MLEIEVLGCGSSVGVPVVGCKCGVCKSNSSYNKRLRSSIIINYNDTKILVDFGFNVKEQLINANVSYLNAAILTHDHADHISGIDELRIFYLTHHVPLNIYVNESIASSILNRYNYLFENERLIMHCINELQELYIGDAKLQIFPQIHGKIKSLGIRIEDFVYSCDISDIPNESEKYLENIKVWIVDCIDYKANFAHSGLNLVLEWDQKYKPQKIYLTNMNHNIDYHKIINELPTHIRPLHDGFKIKL